MKTTIKKTEQLQEWKFPCLGIDSGGCIVLFSRHTVGTLIHVNSPATKNIGYHSTNWCMSDFTPLPPGQGLTLQND